MCPLGRCAENFTNAKSPSTSHFAPPAWKFQVLRSSRAAGRAEIALRRPNI